MCLVTTALSRPLLRKHSLLYKLGKIRMMHFRQSLKIFYFLFLRTVQLYVTCNIQYPQG